MLKRKKILSLVLLTTILLLVTLTFCLTGCGSTAMGFDAPYWHNELAFTGYTHFYEKIEYDVKVVTSTPSNSSEVKNEKAKMEITSSSYVTELEMTEDGRYTYKTSLLVTGNFVVNGEVFPFNNDLTTTTVFENFSKDFAPVSSTRESKSSSSIYMASTGYEVYDLAYNYTITYSDNKAETTYVLKNNSGEREEQTTSNTYKKYNKNGYIDNNLLTLLPRAYKLDEPFSKKFSSIDVVTQKNTKLMYYAASTDASTADVKKFNLEYLKDDTTFNGEISCAKVNIMQDDTFSGAAIEAYYALDDLAPTLHKEHNHRLIKAYTLINDNLGYLEYTIKSVTYKK